MNRGFLWVAISVYLLAMAGWAFRAGMQIRDDAWLNSRTIRFHGDILNGLRYGGQAIRAAEKVANAKNPPVKARAVPTPGAANERSLTLWELYHGADQVYKDLDGTQPEEGGTGLDYPPLRLMAMTLWTYHVTNQIHAIPTWPMGWKLQYTAGKTAAESITEDIARPMLTANAWCVAAAGVFAFFLVWIWVWRGGRPNLPQPRTGWRAWVLPKYRPVPWKPVPVTRINGLLVFCLATWAFFYAVTIAEIPTPPPPPAIAFGGRPVLMAAPDKSITADITAIIDPQGGDAQWNVEYGPTLLYGKESSLQSAGSGDAGVRLHDLPRNTTIHYRLAARNGNGITRTDDATFLTAGVLPPMPPRYWYGEVWLTWTQWVGVGILFLGMAGSLSFLPPVHRGWAAGLVAALFIWFDPSVIVDAHIWPQWDVWMLPPFFLAALLATVDWWFFAGIVLGVGVMFKGQLLMLGPVLALWPLLSGRYGALGRVVSGFVLATGLILSPWLLLDNGPANWSAGPLRWIPSVMAACLVAATVSCYRRGVWERARAALNQLIDEWNGNVPRNSPSPGTPGEGWGGGSAVRTAEFEDPRQPPPYPSPGVPGEETRAHPSDTSLLRIAIFCASLLASIVFVTILVLQRWPPGGTISHAGRIVLLRGILIPPWFLARRALGVWLAAVVATCIWMGGYLYQGDWTWKSVGFEYGTRKFMKMSLGTPSLGNLPQILLRRFGWNIDDTAITMHLPDVAHLLHLGARASNGAVIGWFHDVGLDGVGVPLNIRQFLMLLFIVMTVAAGWGAAMHSRRNDPRILAAFAAVWTLMPAVLCQMAQRYMIFGAAVSSILIGIAPGLGLLHIVLALLGAGMIFQQLTQQWDGGRSPQLMDFLSRFGPDNGWIMLTIGLVFLYVAFAPGRRPADSELDWE